MSKISQYVGLDVSLKETSICVIDDAARSCGAAEQTQRQKPSHRL